MNYAQIYCTLNELLKDLGRQTSDIMVLWDRILSASRFLERQFGNFIPITETRTFGADSFGDLKVDPLLAVTTLNNDDVAVTDYTLKPFNRHWPNGPYLKITQDSGWSEDDVDITGRWGKYEDTSALGVNVTQADATTTSLGVTDGSKVSIGMVLKIEDEQELVTAYGSTTKLTSKVNMSAGIAEEDEEITIDNGAEVAEGELIRIEYEDMLIQKITSHTLTVLRGWNSTKRTTHANDSDIYIYRTFTVTRGVNGTTAAAHSNKAAYRYVIPEDINWLCRQIAGLMHRKAEAGFAGKSGGGDIGEVFYYNEFPTTQLEKVRSNYRIPY